MKFRPVVIEELTHRLPPVIGPPAAVFEPSFGENSSPMRSIGAAKTKSIVKLNATSWQRMACAIALRPTRAWRRQVTGVTPLPAPPVRLVMG